MGLRGQQKRGFKPTALTTYLIRLYKLCEKFHRLPNDGGVENQRWDYMFYFELIESEYAKYNKEMISKRK